MNEARFRELTTGYRRLRIAVVGDFCLDRYLEIDPGRHEISIETGLEVLNVVKVRSQPGAGGTILNNLVALQAGEITPVGFCGEDGEGHELLAALGGNPGVRLEHFLKTPERRTFTYCKPIVLDPGHPPRELNRLDSKNWSPTPAAVQKALRQSLQCIAGTTDAIILMDQVDLADTGVVTTDLLATVQSEAALRPSLLMIGDSRRSLGDWPRVCFKMNSSELFALTGCPQTNPLDKVKALAAELALSHGRPIFITLAEKGIIGADASGAVSHVPAHSVRGEIDIVGAGDAVMANLTASLAAGATVLEALEMAMAAASVVIHQLGTTGTASVEQIREQMFGRGSSGE